MIKWSSWYQHLPVGIFDAAESPVDFCNYLLILSYKGILKGREEFTESLCYKIFMRTGRGTWASTLAQSASSPLSVPHHLSNPQSPRQQEGSHYMRRFVLGLNFKYSVLSNRKWTDTTWGLSPLPFSSVRNPFPKISTWHAPWLSSGLWFHPLTTDASSDQPKTW